MQLNKEDIKVYIVDDEFAIRDALSMLIISEGLSVQCFDSAHAFLKECNPDQPGCLVLDVKMPEMDGIELQKELTNRNIDMPIIFISGHGSVPITASAFRGGAVDFIEKPFDPELLFKRINEAISMLVQTWNKRSKKHRVQYCYGNLTEREKEVMKLVANNHSNKEAARILGISNRTVDVHRAHVMEKMSAESLSDLIVKAIDCEILDNS